MAAAWVVLEAVGSVVVDLEDAEDMAQLVMVVRLPTTCMLITVGLMLRQQLLLVDCGWTVLDSPTLLFPLGLMGMLVRTVAPMVASHLRNLVSKSWSAT